MKPEYKVQTFCLTRDTVDEIGSLVAGELKEVKAEAESAKLLQLAVKRVLLKWLENLGEGTECTFNSGKKVLRPYITLTAPGTQVNPFLIESSHVSGDVESILTILAQIGLVPSYQYNHGQNQLTIMPKRRKPNPIIPLFISIILGVIVGLICHGFPDASRHMFAETFIKPLFDAFIGIMLAMALPTMFLSLIWGIYSIGDMATLSTLGRRVIGRYFGRIYFTHLVCLLIAIPFFPFVLSTEAAGVNEINAISSLLLGIIPHSIVSPFVEGNSLQVIFLAIIFGLSILALNKKSPVIVQFVAQANGIINHIMEWITYIMPVFVFIITVDIILDDMITNISDFIFLFVIIILAILVNIALIVGKISIFHKVSPLTIIKKLLPLFIIGISTSSSAAAFSTNLECSEKKLGINRNLVHFGIPLSLVFSRCGNVIVFFFVCVFVANLYNVEMSIFWLIIAIFTISLMALAMPPVAGGGIACYSILFLQLGIPVEALGIVIILDMLLDFLATSMNVTAAPADLVNVAAKIDMLDEEILKQK